MTTWLFVYGTLRQKSDNVMARRLAREATPVGRGRTRGLLVSLGAYPGLVATSDRESWVEGDVYSLTYPETLAWIDQYEGCGRNDPDPQEFERVEREVVLQSGVRGRAWVYVYCGSPSCAPVPFRGVDR
jgi:gamma-glutamylcyclotransferase (GGCT)/AIG2-like uncharacterized protein YtfP